MSCLKFLITLLSKKWTDQHGPCVRQGKIMSPWQESNPWPPEHWADPPSTKLRELMEFIFNFVINFFFPTGFPCKICPPGSYNNVTRAETCYCCRPGYSSTYMKTSCRACPANEYADQGDFPDCTLCRTCFVKASCKLHEMLGKTLHYDSYICFCWQYNLHGGRVAFFLTLLF